MLTEEGVLKTDYKINPSVTLILFTGSYPYDIKLEQTFISTEIEYLASTFDRMFIIPGKLGGKKHTVPAGVEVEESYAITNQSELSRIKLHSKVLFSKISYEELLVRPSILIQPVARRKMETFINQADLTRKWVVDFIESRKLYQTHCIFYTYWFGQATLGIGLAKKYYPQIKLISRAHGIDLYEERHKPAYIPCRQKSLSFLDGLFLISENGRNYIAHKYPQFSPLCRISRLGVRDPGFVTSCSRDGIFRIVSCSLMLPVKRLDLLLEGIACAAKLRPEQQFEWNHIGDGPLKTYIEDIAHRILPVNIKSRFVGYLPNDHVLLFYKNNSVDLFMNVSEYEGIPVSVMEAISCGIPVVATSVGGTPEIVSDQNGRLLSSNPTPEEIALSILSILDNPDLALNKRKESRRIWQEKFNADMNFQTFANLVRSLVPQLGKVG